MPNKPKIADLYNVASLSISNDPFVGRSGMAFGLNVAAWHGTVDAGYRGEVRVLLRNYSDNNITIKVGDRVAQARLTPSPRVTFEVAEQLDMTERGVGGFGSSGA